MSDATWTDALQQTPFFAGLPVEELEAIVDEERDRAAPAADRG